MNHILLAIAAPKPLIYEAVAGGWPAAAVVLGLALVFVVWAMGDAGLFVALVTVNDRRRRNRDLRRARRRALYADRVVSAARAGGLFDQDGGQ